MLEIAYDETESTPDICRICEEAYSRGVLLTPTEAYKLWSRYSDMAAAGWLTLPEDDDDLWHAICTVLPEKEETDA
jgi:hypothetical protein